MTTVTTLNLYSIRLSRSIITPTVMEKNMQLQEVLDRSGLSASTLRKYVHLGLIPHPAQSYTGLGGSESTYAEDTVDRLGKIESYKQGGKTLAEIQAIFSHDIPNRSSTEIITEYLKSVSDTLKTRLNMVIKLDANSVNLAEKRVIAGRIECVQWQIETIQRPIVFKEQLERVALSEQLKQKYQDVSS